MQRASDCIRWTDIIIAHGDRSRTTGDQSVVKVVRYRMDFINIKGAKFYFFYLITDTPSFFVFPLPTPLPPNSLFYIHVFQYYHEKNGQRKNETPHREVLSSTNPRGKNRGIILINSCYFHQKAIHGEKIIIFLTMKKIYHSLHLVPHKVKQYSSKINLLADFRVLAGVPNLLIITAIS